VTKTFKRQHRSMKGKVFTIIAAAFCAGLFANVVPGSARDVAAGPAEGISAVLQKQTVQRSGFTE